MFFTKNWFILYTMFSIDCKILKYVIQVCLYIQIPKGTKLKNYIKIFHNDEMMSQLNKKNIAVYIIRCNAIQMLLM